MRRYEALDLGDFDSARPHLESYPGESADHRTNRDKVFPVEARELVVERWGEVAQRYGYDPLTPGVAKRQLALQ